MSYLDKFKSKAVIAAATALGFNDGANKGFWRIQLRDGKGQWMEMGRGLLAKVRMSDGSVQDQRGVYIGASERAGYARQLVKEADGNYYIYDVTSRNAEQFDASIPDSVLKKQGITKKTATSATERLDSDIQDIADMNRRPATESDIKLATDAPTDDQKATIQSERDKSPLAKLAPGAEGLMPQDEVAKLIGHDLGDAAAPGAAYDARKAANDKAIDEAPVGTTVKLKDRVNTDGKGGAEITATKTGPDTWRRDSAGGKEVPASNIKDLADGDMDVLPAESATTPDAAPVSSVDDIVKDIMGDVAYGDEVPSLDDLLNKVNAAQAPAGSGWDFNIQPLQQEYKFGLDLKKGDYIIDPKTLDTLKLDGDADWNSDQTAINIPAVDDKGNRRDLEISNDDEVKAITDYQDVAPAKPTANKAAKPADTAPAAPVPTAPGTSKFINATDVKNGDKLYSTNGIFRGDVTKVSNDAVDFNGKPATRVTFVDEDGKTRMETFSRSQQANIDRPSDNAAPAAPAAPAAQPAVPDNAPTAPSAPAAPAAKTKTPAAPKVKVAKAKSQGTKNSDGTTTKPSGTKTPKGSAIAAAKKTRADKGQYVSPGITPQDELRAKKITPLFGEDGKPLMQVKNGKSVPAEDPDAIVNGLLEEFPQAVIGSDDAIIIERSQFTDNDGKTYQYETAVERTFDNKFMERYKFKDLATGEEQTFYHYDYKDSFKGLFGEKNGLYVFRDQLLGRSTPGNPKSEELRKWFGEKSPLERRVRFFRNKSAAGRAFTPEDYTKTSFKLLTPDELVDKFLEGRPRELNLAKNSKTYGSVLKNYLQNFWEVLENDYDTDGDQVLQTLVQALGHLPDNEGSRSLLINKLKSGIKTRYSGHPQQAKFAQLPSVLEKQLMSEGFDLRDIQRRPWASRNGRTIIEQGDKVRYYNSQGEESVGTIIALNPSVAGYQDTARVRFANGTVANILATKYMDRLTGTDNEDSTPTDYIPSPKGAAMIAARGLPSLASVVDFGDVERRKSDAGSAGVSPDDDGDDADPAPAVPYLGNSGVSADDQTPAAPVVGNVASMDTGDAWYSEDGDYLGSVAEIVELDALDGGDPGLGVYYMDQNGDEHIEVVEMGANRGPK